MTQSHTPRKERKTKDNREHVMQKEQIEKKKKKIHWCVWEVRVVQR